MGVRLVITTMESDGTRVTAALELDHPRIVFGRGASSDVVLPHASVSSVHATLRSSASGYVIVDERSTNGTRVGDVHLAPERPRALRSQDRIRVGPYSIEVTLGVPIALASTADDATAAAKRLVILDDAEPMAAALVFIDGTRAGDRLEIPTDGTWIIGRAEDADVRVDDGEISRRHAELVFDTNGAVVRDAGSKNGVVVNGRSVQKRRLRDGDKIEVGATTIAYEDVRDRAIADVANLAEDAPPSEVDAFDAPRLPDPEPDASPPSPVPGESLEFVEGDDREPAQPARAPAGARSAPSHDALVDRMVYGLALLVLGLSIAAIVWIFGGS